MARDGLTNEQAARVRAGLEKLLAEEAALHGTHGAGARVARRLGLTGAAVSLLRVRADGSASKHSPSLPTTAAIARELGVSPEQLLYGRAPTGALHRDLAGWATAEARALAAPEEVVPHRAVRAVGGLPAMFQPQPLDAGYVIALATLWQDYAAEADDADVVDARAKMAAEDAAERGQKPSVRARAARRK